MIGHKIKRIALIGPECTGKSWLCKQLALHYRTNFIEELSRTYFSGIKHSYTIHDIEVCSMQQLQMEKVALAQSKEFIFIDTEIIIAKVWCIDVFKTSPVWMDEEINKNPYDLYLLIHFDIDVLENDDMRYNIHRREYFFDCYKKELENAKLNFTIIKGKFDVRLQNCINSIGEL